MIQISEDGGKTWDTREAPSVAAPIDVSVNPGDPKVWAVSTDQGIFVSHNEGKSWRQRDTTVRRPHLRGARLPLYAAGKDGKVKQSPDNGSSWQDVGSIGAGPKELIVSPEGELYASVTGPAIRRSTDGGNTPGKRSSRIGAPDPPAASPRALSPAGASHSLPS